MTRGRVIALDPQIERETKTRSIIEGDPVGENWVGCETMKREK